MLQGHDNFQVPIEELHQEPHPPFGIRRILQNARQPRQRSVRDLHLSTDRQGGVRRQDSIRCCPLAEKLYTLLIDRHRPR
jgi:hypothetical protein